MVTSFQRRPSRHHRSGVTYLCSSPISDGSHFNADGSLKPNTTYEAGEHRYRYRTDANGHIIQFDADVLKFKTHEGRLKHDSDTPGKLPGNHAGHLGGDRFGGSHKLDNIVSQLSSVNLSAYEMLENKWATALKEGKDVSVHVQITNDQTGRPSTL
ncbi:DNA/RNA non-specific endonuclease [Tsukamurella asaccharolytica]|uniref:DNA/RNA non-specific endonuclease n=1 Tax=Tsukamurella asaccharolytica TaxID=2592067 RepID=UPI00195FED38|nr:DNA/RNA non-specific endonuclease [Tsukamurella asaccharolytica]